MTPLSFHPPRFACPSGVRAMCEATIGERRDIRRVWWLTAEYLQANRQEASRFQDELHIELLVPPGPHGVTRQLFVDFQWTAQPVGSVLHWTFTPQPLLPDVRAVGELVAEMPV
jgi:hypothetical protein